MSTAVETTSEASHPRSAGSPPEQGGSISIVGSVSAAASGVGATVYSGANAVYQRTPDLGVASTLSKWTSGGSGEMDESNATSSATASASTDTTLDSESQQRNSAEHFRDLEQERGPSNHARVDKPQKQIGTEYGIPTAAGAGTTLSPDESVRPAAEKEKALRNREEIGGKSEAAVGQDYRDQPCPTGSAGRDKPTSKPAEGKTGFSDEKEQQHGSANTAAASEGDDESQKTLVHGSESHDGEDGKASQPSRSLAQKIKEKVKGEARVISGRIHKDEDRVLEGQALKQGVDKTEIRV